MAYWTYIDDETKEQLTLCDFADLAPIAAEQARSSLSNAYGEDDAPDFDDIGTLELSSWCEAFGVLFETSTGFPRWTDAAETVTQRHYIHPDSRKSCLPSPTCRTMKRTAPPLCGSGKRNVLRKCGTASNPKISLWTSPATYRTSTKGSGTAPGSTA